MLSSDYVYLYTWSAQDISPAEMMKDDFFFPCFLCFIQEGGVGFAMGYPRNPKNLIWNHKASLCVVNHRGDYTIFPEI